ncbi:hypothetical protein BAE44_0020183 [Dichanthelium oligosanthes]|uniref:MAPK kinase substrate protein n=1 Tax=Dichanthelium oligosanthes TaxID=888268 RepID=A0A1E5V0Y3_9POAL|nr:hypothetical protein BAE44_0020183 [Dichanthelium oligosanthes]
MAGLQRSATTFRRSGSSGLVWDERFLTEAEDAEAKAKASDGAAEEPQPELRHSRSVGSIGMLRRGGAGADADGSNGQQVFRTKDVAPDVDPPSPRVSGCILCTIFGGSGSGGAARRRSKPRKK